MMTNTLSEITTAMVLSDATMFKMGTHAGVKFEQGYQQREFVYHLYHKYSNYCFMIEPRAYVAKTGEREGLIKSY